MGAVIPPEVEPESTLQAPQVHSNGHSIKLGDNFTASPKIQVKEINGKLNEILDLEDQPLQEDSTVEAVRSPHQEASSEDAEADYVQQVKTSEGENGVLLVVEDLTHHTIIEPDPVEIEEGDGASTEAVASKTSEASAEDTVSKGPEDVVDSSGQWTAGAPNSVWEIAEDESVLGPGPSAEDKGAVVKSTAAKEVYTYYMIRIPRPTDSKVRAEIRMAELRLKEKTEKRDFINAAFQMKKANRFEALDKLRLARDKVRSCGDAARSKREEVEPLQGALRKLRDAGRLARDKSRDLPASEHELDERIGYLEYRIQHESIPLREEKQLLRDIKNLKACREEVIAYEALNAEFSESLGEREDIQDRLKPLISELEALKAEWTVASEKTRAAEAEFEKMDEALNQVQAQWLAANRARQDAYEERAALLRQENARNDEYYQNRREIQHVRQLAFKKEKKTVEELCNAQVERVMSLWNSNVEFRAAYVKDNERSTLKRLHTFDGRGLGPDEEPPLLSGEGEDSPFDVRRETGPSVTTPSSRKGEPSKAVSAEPSQISGHPISDAPRIEHEKESGLAAELNGPGRLSTGKATTGSDKLSRTTEQEERVQADFAASAAEQKEKRRQQEMAKAREAEERKKRSAERSQSKALARGKKEAERREKEKEKKARKKAASLLSSNQGVSPSAETEGGVVQDAEPIVGVVQVQDTPVQSKPGARQRKRPATQKSKSVKTPLPILSKKESIYQQTWFWIVVGLVILLGILAILAMFVL